MKSIKIITLSLLLIATLRPEKSHAFLFSNVSSGDYCLMGCVGGMVTLEPIIPDLRYEHTFKNNSQEGEDEKKDSLVLSWPFHFYSYTSTAYDLRTSLFLEPQLNMSNDNGRFLAGTRLTKGIFNTKLLIFEGGGIKDRLKGNGAFVSLGIGKRLSKIFDLAVICRTSITEKEVRTDLSFDLCPYWIQRK